MDAQMNPRPINPRRRRKSKIEIFKESYLPVIILGIAVLLVLIFIIGAISRSGNKNKDTIIESTDSSYAAEAMRLNEEAASLMLQAEALGRTYDYSGAIAVLDTFSGDITQFPDMQELRDEMTLARSQMVTWDDPSEILHLSVQMLIADPQRAFNDDVYASSFRKNFLTTQEFADILPQLYQNGYMLISLDDILTSEISADGSTVFSTKTLYLPQGKKPLLLTQTNVSYPTYLLDSDYDGQADKGGCGFASKLVFDDYGDIACEYVDGTGQTLVGDYDMIPILDNFIEEHPDFSYGGAKAIIAVSGYEGVFGYRTDPAQAKEIGTAAYEAQMQTVRDIADKLTSDGYTLACFTYNDVAYGSLDAAQIQEDLDLWANEISPILGKIDIFAFSRDGDIASANTTYSDDRFTPLKNAGYRIYLGFCQDGERWFTNGGDYVRMGRILLTPSTLINHPEWFTDVIDGTLVVDQARGDIKS